MNKIFLKLASTNQMHKNRIAKTILAIHNSFSRDTALIYIGGELVEGSVHPAMVSRWLAKHDKYPEVIQSYYTIGPGKAKNLSKEEIDKIIDKACEEYRLPDDILADLTNEYGDHTAISMPKNIPYCAINKATTDTDTIYYIISEAKEHCTIEDVKNALIKRDPNAFIVDDTTDKPIYEPKGKKYKGDPYIPKKKHESFTKTIALNDTIDTDKLTKNINSLIDYMKQNLSEIEEFSATCSGNELTFDVEASTTDVLRLGLWIKQTFNKFIKDYPEYKKAE